MVAVVVVVVAVAVVSAQPEPKKDAPVSQGVGAPLGFPRIPAPIIRAVSESESVVSVGGGRRRCCRRRCCRRQRATLNETIPVILKHAASCRYLTKDLRDLAQDHAARCSLGAQLQASEPSSEALPTSDCTSPPATKHKSEKRQQRVEPSIMDFTKTGRQKSSSDELEVECDDFEVECDDFSGDDELPTVEAGAFQVDEDVDLDSSKLRSLLTMPSLRTHSPTPHLQWTRQHLLSPQSLRLTGTFDCVCSCSLSRRFSHQKTFSLR